MPHRPADTDRTLKPLVARIDEDVHDALVAWAQHEDRSLAGQVRIALRQVVPSQYMENGSK